MYTVPRGFSQCTTSFFGIWRLGILHAPLIAYSASMENPMLSSVFFYLLVYRSLLRSISQPITHSKLTRFFILGRFSLNLHVCFRIICSTACAKYYKCPSTSAFVMYSACNVRRFPMSWFSHLLPAQLFNAEICLLMLFALINKSQY